MDELQGLRLLSLSDFNFSQIEEDSEYQYNMWLCTPEGIYPSKDSEIKKNIDSGIYKVNYSNDSGYFMTKESISTDELFLFNNSDVPKLLKEVISFWEKRDLFKESKFLHKMGILLYGEPGTGKTSIISLLINKLINSDSIVFLVNDKETFLITKGFIPIFRKIEPEKNIIIVIEGLENLDAGESLLNLLDGKDSVQHQLIIATSNNTSELEDSLLRPSRFDKRLYIGLPNEETKKEYLKTFNLSEEELEKYLSVSKNYSFAHLRNLIFSVKFLGSNFDEVVKELENSCNKENYNDNYEKPKSIGF